MSIYETQAAVSNNRSKDNHLVYQTGDTIFVLLIMHEKLPPNCFLGEKEDGTGGWGRGGGCSCIVHTHARVCVGGGGGIQAYLLFCCQVPSLLYVQWASLHKTTWKM